MHEKPYMYTIPKVYVVSKRGSDFILAIIVALFGHDYNGRYM